MDALEQPVLKLRRAPIAQKPCGTLRDCVFPEAHVLSEPLRARRWLGEEGRWIFIRSWNARHARLSSLRASHRLHLILHAGSLRRRFNTSHSIARTGREKRARTPSRLSKSSAARTHDGAREHNGAANESACPRARSFNGDGDNRNQRRGGRSRIGRHASRRKGKRKKVKGKREDERLALISSTFAFYLFPFSFLLTSSLSTLLTSATRERPGVSRRAATFRVLRAGVPRRMRPLPVGHLP